MGREQFRKDEKVTFVVNAAETVNFAGGRKFIEVGRKTAKTVVGESQFIQLATGSYDASGNKRYKSSIAMPVDKDLVESLRENLKKVL